MMVKAELILRLLIVPLGPPSYLCQADKLDPELIAKQVHFRLCKGVYKSPQDQLIFDHQQVRDRYLDFAQQMLDAGVYVGLAIYDLWFIERLEAYLSQHHLGPDRFEWQALMGVPIDDNRGSSWLHSSHNVLNQAVL